MARDIQNIGIFNYDDVMGIEMVMAPPSFDIQKLRDMFKDFANTAKNYLIEANAISNKSTEHTIVLLENQSKDKQYLRDM